MVSNRNRRGDRGCDGNHAESGWDPLCIAPYYHQRIIVKPRGQSVKKQFSWLYLPFDMWRAGLEAQQVINLRLAMLAGGGMAASAETNWMIAEKMSAALEVQHMATTAVLTGNPAEIPSTVALYRRKMRDSRRRLVKSSALPRPRRAKKSRPT